MQGNIDKKKTRPKEPKKEVCEIKWVQIVVRTEILGAKSPSRRTYAKIHGTICPTTSLLPPPGPVGIPKPVLSSLYAYPHPWYV
jgi:hypothetical protein